MEVGTDTLLVYPARKILCSCSIDEVLEAWRPDGRPSANRHAGLMNRIPLPRGAIARGNYPEKFSDLTTPIGLKSRAFLPTTSGSSG